MNFYHWVTVLWLRLQSFYHDYNLSFLSIRNFIVCFPLSQIHAFLKRYLPVGLMHLVLAAYVDPVVFTNVRKLRVVNFETDNLKSLTGSKPTCSYVRCINLLLCLLWYLRDNYFIFIYSPSRFGICRIIREKQASLAKIALGRAHWNRRA